MKRKGLVFLSAIWVGLLFFPTIVFAGGKQEKTEEAMKEKVLKVGIASPFTGPHALDGQNNKDACVMRFEEAGLKVGDYRIELMFVDTTSDAAKSTEAFAEAIERKGMQVAISGFLGYCDQAALDVTNPAGVPIIGTQGSSMDLSIKTRGLKPGILTKFWPAAEYTVPSYTDFIVHAEENTAWHPKQKKYAVLGIDNDWGRNWVHTFIPPMEKAGWKTAYQAYTPPEQTDFYPILTQFKKEGIELIAFMSSSIASASAMAKQIKELEIKALVILDGLGWVGNWYEMTGKASDGILDSIPIWLPTADNFRKNFKQKFGYEPSAGTAGIAYDSAGMALKIFKRALEKYGKLDSETVLKISADEVATGKLTYGFDDGSIMMKEYKYTLKSYPDPVVDPDHYYFPILQYMNGKITVVYPGYMANAEFVVP